MELQEALRQFAVKNIWCSPLQDHQAIFKLARLTDFGGVWNRFSIEWITLNLPENDAPFHVYQIGQNCPFDLGLFPQRGLWIKLSDLCTTQSMIADLYLDNGVQIPRSQSYICRTSDKNFILCVKEVLAISDLNAETLNLRLYSDQYFSSSRGEARRSKLVCNGMRVGSISDINTMQAEIQAIKPAFGYVNIWHNGRYVNNVSAAKVKVGDYVEYLYDPSVAAVIDFPISSLPAFRSKLDSLDKFILHPPKRGDASIYYRDDVDIFLIKKEAGDYVNGIYYHRNREDSLRMLTHRDYSIPSAYVTGYVKDDLRWKNDASGLIVRVMVRESGYSRSLVHEINRIHEIYKLPDAKILRAFQGLDSTLKEWTADWLESANYPYVMRCWYPEITPGVVIDAMGHNSIAEFVGKTPTVVTHTNEGIDYVDLPWGLQQNATMYEYDAGGLLLGFYYHTEGARYYTANKSADLVEGICGQATQSVEAYYGKVALTLDPLKSYRFYISDVLGGGTQNNWREVTEADGFFKVTDNVVTWSYDESRKVGCVVSDSKFLGYTLDLDQPDGFFRFHVNYTDVQGVVMELPVGKLELWLGGPGKPGRSLVPGLDYFVNWPEVVIVNKEWLNVDGINTVTIRCTDWAQKDGSMLPQSDAGFVQHGLLSNDKIYQIRDDHVIRCVADGRTFHRDQLVFAEQKYGLKLKDAANVLDGRPYWISDIRVPFTGIPQSKVESLRAQAADVDKRAGDYLAKQFTPPTFDQPPFIKWRYRVYSPVITKLISDIIRGWFVPPQMPCPDQTVMESFKDYEYILPFDPARLQITQEYVTVHPHPWSKTRTVTQSQYLYLKKITELYLNDLVDITQFLTIKG